MGSCQSSPSTASSVVVTSVKNDGGGNCSNGLKKNPYPDNNIDNLNHDHSEQPTEISVSGRTFSGPSLQQQHQDKHLDDHNNEETEATMSADGSDKSSPQSKPTDDDQISSINNNNNHKAKPTPTSVPTKSGDGGTTHQMQKRYSRITVDSSDKNKASNRRGIKPGYSSGGSSCSDEHEDSARKHLVDLKNELGADGDLAKGIVNIEVSVSFVAEVTSRFI